MAKGEIFGQQKILNHIDKVQNWINGGNDTLVTVELDMSNACNSRCPHCAGWFETSKAGMLSLREAKSYIKQLKKANVRGLTLTGGGEPTMNPNTKEAIEYAYKLGFDIGFFTNGLFLPDSLLRIILHSCLFLRFSINAGTPEMFKQMHGLNGKDFDRVIDNIKSSVSVRKMMNAKCDIGMGYITSKKTIDGMEDFVKLASELKVNYAQFRNLLWEHESIEPVFSELKKKYDTDNFKVACSIQKYSRFKDKDFRPYDKCYGVHFTSVIGADSKVYVCCNHRGRKKYVLGDLKKESFKRIWAKRENVFKNINLKECPPFCRNDEMSRFLFELKKEKAHINFL